MAWGGILSAVGIAFVPRGDAGPDFSHAPALKFVLDIGLASFALLLPVLAGYIAYSIAGRPGLVPGFIGGYLSGEVKAGFLGAIFAGVVGGFFSEGHQKIPCFPVIRPGIPLPHISLFSAPVLRICLL